MVEIGEEPYLDVSARASGGFRQELRVRRGVHLDVLAALADEDGDGDTGQEGGGIGGEQVAQELVRHPERQSVWSR